MKKLFIFSIILSAVVMMSCNSNSSSEKKSSDSAYSGLEGTHEDRSQLSGSKIDTSSGQSSTKTANDSTYLNRKTLPSR